MPTRTLDPTTGRDLIIIIIISVLIRCSIDGNGLGMIFVNSYFRQPKKKNCR